MDKSIIIAILSSPVLVALIASCWPSICDFFKWICPKICYFFKWICSLICNFFKKIRTSKEDEPLLPSVNGSQSSQYHSAGPSSDSQTNTGPSSEGQTNAGSNPGNQTNTGKPSGGETTAGPSSGHQMSGAPMISAGELNIEHSRDPECWDSISIEDPRFTKVAVLLQVWFFHIKTSKNFLGLLANTKYGAYLIFKRKEDSEGLDVIMNTSVSVGRKQETKSVCLKPTGATPAIVGRPKERSDGWLELELGKFDCDIVTNKDAVIIIKETERKDIKKAGLIVAGIEIRAVN